MSSRSEEVNVFKSGKSAKSNKVDFEQLSSSDSVFQPVCAESWDDEADLQARIWNCMLRVGMEDLMISAKSQGMVENFLTESYEEETKVKVSAHKITLGDTEAEEETESLSISQR